MIHDSKVLQLINIHCEIIVNEALSLCKKKQREKASFYFDVTNIYERVHKRLRHAAAQELHCINKCCGTNNLHTFCLKVEKYNSYFEMPVYLFSVRVNCRRTKLLLNG
jgi:hypothetical protein